MSRRGQGRVYRPTYRDKQTGDLRKSAVWWISVPIRGKDGRRTKHRESSGSTSKQEAVKLLNKRLGEAGHGRLLGPSVERTTYTELEQMLLDNLRANGRRSVDRPERSLAHLKRSLAWIERWTSRQTV
jgi:hypothetical protein